MNGSEPLQKARAAVKAARDFEPAGEHHSAAEDPEPFYGPLAFARDLDAERRRLDQQALQAALDTLNAQEAAI